ncbi:MAG: cytochrome C [Polaromonas sp.]|nr:cytochrome C [Polaromonas sp.]
MTPQNTHPSLGALAKQAALITALAVGTAHASTPEELARASGCMSCHSAAEKVVGPSFKSIADKYRGQADAVASLSQSVRNGSRGNWGRIPMPPHASLAEADIKTLVTWVVKH